MSTTTQKLGLIQPEHTDEQYQTIMDLQVNFQKLDDVAEIHASAPPTSGQHHVRMRIWNDKPTPGGFVGWICTRAGIAASRWKGLTSYTLGNRITTTVDNGHIYECIQTGYSAVQEPTFPVSSGGEVQDTKGATTWRASTNYNQQDIVFPSIDNGRFYVCTVAGESGTFEPAWAASNGITTPDGTAVWSSYRIAKWREIGISAEFRPFGKIE
ncbi:hypothetical protein [Paenibacillus massiliensis]|uniref:hypothetical protein n=1 Tax=Paenibacillus massiliensis TaxID=225917 RepID=UPI0003F847DD|nr:hypothetical protein [Paenibacillus massiliensis]